ncbi:MAG TPA: flagellar protein FlaF [Methanomicrobiales archaeon]|nr:flagellar protein FlaF [Methanomicrobiales archaeon]
MGAGTIIASAVAIILLIITAYVLIGGTLATAKTAVLAQRAISEKENERIHTNVEIMNVSNDLGARLTYLEVKNTGSEILGDFNHTEVYLMQGGVPYTYTNLSAPYDWVYRIMSPDLVHGEIVHPGLLDPDEVVNISVAYDPDPLKGDPVWVKVSTANGVYDSAYIV